MDSFTADIAGYGSYFNSQLNIYAAYGQEVVADTTKDEFLTPVFGPDGQTLT